MSLQENFGVILAIIAIFLCFVMTGDSLEDFSSKELSNICSDNTSFLKYNGSSWVCFNQTNNYTLVSANGTLYTCGVNNSGFWLCN